MLNVVAGTDPDDPVDRARRRRTPRRLALGARHGRAARASGSATSRASGMTRSARPARSRPSKAALKYLTDAGATIVEMGSTVGDANTPPAPREQPDRQHARRRAGCSTSTPIRSWPSRASQIRNAVDVSCSQKKVAYTRADPSACAAAPAARMTAGGDDRPPQLPRCVQGQRQDVAGHRRRGQPRRRRRRLPGPAERHQPQRRRRRQGELRPPRHAGRRPGHPDRRLPGGLQRSRPADQPAAARPRVGRRQARRHGLRVRGAGGQGRQGPRGGDHRSGADGRRPTPAPRSAAPSRRRCR